MTPAIILKTQFSTSKFKGYLKYINDEKSNQANHDNKKIQNLNQDIENINNEMSNINLSSYSSYIIGYMKNNSIAKKDNQNKKKVIKRTTAPFNNNSNTLDNEELDKVRIIV